MKKAMGWKEEKTTKRKIETVEVGRKDGVNERNN